jgi:hypothetical protein
LSLLESKQQISKLSDNFATNPKADFNIEGEAMLCEIC